MYGSGFINNEWVEVFDENYKFVLIVKTKKDTDVLLNGPSRHGLTC